jgi:hypothetical protein
MLLIRFARPGRNDKLTAWIDLNPRNLQARVLGGLQRPLQVPLPEWPAFLSVS